MTEINKYNNSMIYTIRSPHTDKYYIGSTTQILCKRFSDHKVNYNDYLNEKYHFVTSFKIFELGDAYVELLEEVNCENKHQLVRREGELIRLHKNECVNKRIEGRTQKEYQIDNKEEITKQRKQYTIEHAKEKSLYDKKFAIDNKEMINKYRTQPYNCLCGSTIQL